jgi:hypothetical protein
MVRILSGLSGVIIRILSNKKASRTEMLLIEVIVII